MATPFILVHAGIATAENAEIARIFDKLLNNCIFVYAA